VSDCQSTKKAQILKNNKYADLARNNNHEFVPLVAESLGGLGNAAVKLFGEIARSQASSRHPVGHILRRLIDISQIAVRARQPPCDTNDNRLTCP
jgi:hypothetical protein